MPSTNSWRKIRRRFCRRRLWSRSWPHLQCSPFINSRFPLDYLRFHWLQRVSEPKSTTVLAPKSAAKFRTVLAPKSRTVSAPKSTTRRFFKIRFFCIKCEFRNFLRFNCKENPRTIIRLVQRIRNWNRRPRPQPPAIPSKWIIRRRGPQPPAIPSRFQIRPRSRMEAIQPKFRIRRRSRTEAIPPKFQIRRRP